MATARKAAPPTPPCKTELIEGSRPAVSIKEWAEAHNVPLEAAFAALQHLQQPETQLDMSQGKVLDSLAEEVTAAGAVALAVAPQTEAPAAAATAPAGAEVAGAEMVSPPRAADTTKPKSSPLAEQGTGASCEAAEADRLTPVQKDTASEGRSETESAAGAAGSAAAPRTQRKTATCPPQQIQQAPDSMFPINPMMMWWGPGQAAGSTHLPMGMPSMHMAGHMSRQLLQQQQGYATSAPPTPNSQAGSRSARSVTGESHPAEAMKLLRLSRNPKRMRELP